MRFRPSRLPKSLKAGRYQKKKNHYNYELHLLRILKVNLLHYLVSWCLSGRTITGAFYGSEIYC